MHRYTGCPWAAPSRVQQMRSNIIWTAVALAIGVLALGWPSRLAESIHAQEIEPVEIFIRVIDADTGKPLANTECRLHQVYFYDSSISYGHRYKSKKESIARKTDASGILRFTGAVFDDTWDAAEGEKAGNVEVVFVEGEYDYERGVHRYKLPVPEGWWPVTDCGTAADALTKAFESRETVDVTVRRNADLEVAMLDSDGRRIEDANIALTLLGDRWEESEWASTYCDIYDFTWERFWARESQERLETGRALRVNAAFEGKELQSPEWGNAELQNTWRDIPSAKFAIVGTHLTLGVAVAVEELRPGQNYVEIRIPTEPTADLNVRVEWHGEAPGQGAAPLIQLRKSSPLGPAESITREWDLSAKPEGIWEGTITGLEPGWWCLTAIGGNRRSEGASVAFVAEADGEQDIRLCVGPSAVGTWRPDVRLDGRALRATNIILLGGGEHELKTHLVKCDPDQDNPPELQLPAGTWTAWVDGFRRHEFTLKPGETRTDTFDRETVEVKFTISEELHAVAADKKGRAKLTLAPIGEDMWKSATRDALLEATEKQDKDFQYLRPDKSRNWLLPEGVYRWWLSVGDSAVWGNLTVNRGDGIEFDFTLDGMPGLKPVRIEFDGFESDELPYFEVLTESDAHVVDVGNCNFLNDRGPDIVYPVESPWFDAAGYIELPGTTTKIAFAPPGVALVAVRGQSVVTTSCPGSATIGQGEEEIALRTELTFSGLEDNARYDVEIIYPDGTTVGANGLNKKTVPQGQVRLIVQRTDYELVPEDSSMWAEIELNIEGTPVDVRLDALEYQKYAVVDLWFRGRNDSLLRDPWWEPCAEDRLPYMVALDDVILGQPRKLLLIAASDSSTSDGLEFGYRNRLLRPGRYRLVPWLGAPESACREIVLKPGRNKRIVVEGQ